MQAEKFFFEQQGPSKTVSLAFNLLKHMRVEYSLLDPRERPPKDLVSMTFLEFLLIFI